MSENVRYVHTNLIAKDWKKLADFYINVFHCKIVPPERNLSGQWIEDMTGIADVKVNGVHLSLPGFENGPTLEIFQYSPEDIIVMDHKINQPGFGHLAFHVDSVQDVLETVLEHGGSQMAKVITKQYETLGLLTAVYVTDPEGNFIEIQNWSKCTY
jgi:predicted enzyme related to lactoylglutathione lyase